MSFRVGQKVVAIDTWALNGRGRGDEAGPVKGTVYAIRDIGYLQPFYPTVICVLLAEIINPVCNYEHKYYEAPFWVGMFRPVTDISVFTEMLRVADDRVKA